MFPKIEKSISINAQPSTVWQYLVDPNLMVQWMGDPSMNIEVITDWVPGSPKRTKFFHHINIEIKGTVLQFQPYSIIQYTHLDSNAPLTDTPENYTIITFFLAPDGEKTTLTITAENFPMETIYRHLNFYWQGTTVLIKKCVEQELGAEHSS